MRLTHEAFMMCSDEFFDRCKCELSVKNKDYSPLGLAFEEVRKTAEVTNTTPIQVLYIYMSKHLSALQTFILKGELASEEIHGRLVDIANYSALLDVLIDVEAAEDYDHFAELRDRRRRHRDDRSDSVGEQGEVGTRAG